MILILSSCGVILQVGLKNMISTKTYVLSLSAFSLLGYEGVEVINPEGGKEDAEEEAQRGRWKQEVWSIFRAFIYGSN